MTLVFGTQQHVGDAKTHVLIIGVGRYKHLPGGPGPITPNVPPLGQLQSPPASARALADWFTGNEHQNPDAPLGSVELLLSDANSQQYAAPQDGSQALEIERAEIMNIMRAFNEWYARCNAHEDNVCFFYFCGHGLHKQNTYLLPEDFAAFPNNWWFNAVDFDRTYNGMRQCAAKTQYYVVDSCRQWTTGMMQNLDVTGQTLMQTTSLSNIRERTAPRLFATAIGLPAFGDQGGVSRLTTALLECLEGSGAQKQNEKWLVSTSSLGESVQQLVNLKNAALPQGDRQAVDPAGGDAAVGPRVLHMLPAGVTPKVFVTLDCDPDAATPSALFYFQRKGARQDAPEPGQWSTRLEADIYEFGVHFPQGPYRSSLRSAESIRPPVLAVRLEV